jgi:hypothetical protein
MWLGTGRPAQNDIGGAAVHAFAHTPSEYCHAFDSETSKVHAVMNEMLRPPANTKRPGRRALAALARSMISGMMAR